MSNDDSEKMNNKISICDIMRDTSSQIIQKLESQIPSKVQQYSDLYSAYLHSLDDMFSTCYLSEKEFFDNLNIDQNTLKSFQQSSQIFSQLLMDQIDLYANYRQNVAKMQVSGIKTYDKFVHTMMKTYAQYLSQFNKLTSKNL